MAKKKTTRTFEGTRKNKRTQVREPFVVETTLTDDEAIELLGGIDGPKSFENDCACAVAILKAGGNPRPNLLAWAFRLAEDKRNAPGVVTLSGDIRKVTAPRRPFKGETEGFPFAVSFCGPNSQHHGSYAITDGGPFRQNEFYGYATPEGDWQPRNGTPAEVVKFLTEFKF